MPNLTRCTRITEPIFYQLESRACGPWPPPIKKPRHRTGLRPHEAPYSGEDASMSANNGACFIIRDHNGQALSYIYYENEPGRRAAANLLTHDEARRIAINIARLPELVK